ncbi:hypothetical protein Aple_093350 [Acrocarpospora pleiomorpha]|uniref:Uncharacterized protein n=1 Tax=Acrocarpospora pleiomorpha TaxID=90975 RepID=A0A5M3XZS4_9ACTN|nr:hypothetical protein Aple_093350 [Acrocarpospora pleiomorpha]
METSCGACCGGGVREAGTGVSPGSLRFLVRVGSVLDDETARCGTPGGWYGVDMTRNPHSLSPGVQPILAVAAERETYCEGDSHPPRLCRNAVTRSGACIRWRTTRLCV